MYRHTSLSLSFFKKIPKLKKIPLLDFPHSGLNRLSDLLFPSARVPFVMPEFAFMQKFPGEDRAVAAHELRTVLAVSAAAKAAVHVALQAYVNLAAWDVKLKEVPGRHPVEDSRPADEDHGAVGVHLDSPH